MGPLHGPRAQEHVSGQEAAVAASRRAAVARKGRKPARSQDGSAALRLSKNKNYTRVPRALAEIRFGSQT